jgi:Uma2 family endonuclease
MASTLSELPVIPLDQHAFNLKRWEEICADETLAAFEFRIETDEFGQTIMSPPPTPEHGEEQSEISHLIRIHAKFPGRTITECPVSTSGGVKAADVAWISMERREAQRGQKAFTTAPEICVEVLSPSNTRNEIEEKKSLYFESGAEEVWICGLDGTIDFFLAGAPDVPAKSDICPDCPLKVVLS